MNYESYAAIFLNSSKEAVKKFHQLKRLTKSKYLRKCLCNYTKFRIGFK